MNENFQNLELDNHGERLVPGYSHDSLEIIRHRSTYQLYKNIITADILRNPFLLKSKIRILDLGCGTGHGSHLLAQIPNSNIDAIDISEDAIAFAKSNYSEENINFFSIPAEKLLDENKSYNYIVSRHALEHISNGIDIFLKFNFQNRFFMSVPYKEKKGNPYHIHIGIDEKFFSRFSNKEFIYENLRGENDLKEFMEDFTNSITCISSKDGHELIKNILPFPQPPYRFRGIEKLFFSPEGRKDLEYEEKFYKDKYHALLNSRGVRFLKLIKKLINLISLQKLHK